VQKLGALVIAVLLAAATRPADAIIFNPTSIDRPDGQGDQLIFYYDARASFTTFLNLHNAGGGDVDVEVLFYGPTFSSPLRRTITIAGGGTQIIDVSDLKTAEPALPEQFGVAIATAIDNHGHPIVTRALSGNFTVASLLVQSAWGAPAAARSAFTSVVALTNPLSDGPPELGTRIDGTTVQLPPIQPTSAHLAVYYNPDTLEPPSLGGNQLIFIAFEDVPGDTYSAQVSLTSWSVDAAHANGSSVGPTSPFLASGVVVTDLATVAGTGVNGSSGSMSFTALASASPLNRFIFFTETLGTFATGYLLPPAIAEPIL